MLGCMHFCQKLSLNWWVAQDSARVISAESNILGVGNLFVEEWALIAQTFSLSRPKVIRKTNAR